ncbi:MAG: hypothetical protein AAFN30_13320 [Actinomycetota bacterium]
MLLGAAPVGDATAIGFYLVYAAIAVGLVVFLARTLQRNGATFLTDVFDQPDLANAVNQLLVIGFYLLNLGYAFLIYQLQPDYAGVIEAFNELTLKLGLLLLSLGVIHLLNMAVFWRIRTHRERGYRPNPGAYTPPPPRPRASNPAPMPTPAGAPMAGPPPGPSGFPEPE